MLEWLSTHTVGLSGAVSALGASIAFMWSAIQLVLVRRKDQQAREFDTFHRLVKELVAPDEKTGTTWLDRQIAVVFELRHFQRYYEITARILFGLRQTWAGADPRLIQEIDLTLSYIRKRKPNLPLQPTVASVATLPPAPAPERR
jgi:hypothetical protein